MSSLANQLKAISEKTASVALDRKSRSAIHSRSVIFAPKVAATQDYDYLFDIGLEGYEELCDIDRRFTKFGNTLFSSTALNLDRNVEDQETVDHLDKTITAFLELLGPYYQLNPSLKALEWLVRRFHANIHCAEPMIMSVLPHYQTPVFLKVINVVPKQSVPPLFQWINGFKEPQPHNPSMQAVTRAFYSEFEFFKAYTFAIESAIANHTTYSQLLGFYVSVSVQVLASKSKQPELIASQYLPVVLAVVAKMLSSPEVSTKLAAYSIVAVVSTIAPLTPEVISGIARSILADSVVLAPVMAKQTYVILGQLWHYYPGDFSEDCGLVPLKGKLDIDVLQRVVAQEYHTQRWLMFTYLATGELPVLRLINTKAAPAFYLAALNKAIETSDAQAATYLYNANQDGFTAALEKLGTSIDEVEMKLLTTLRPTVVEDVVVEVTEDNDDEVDLSSVSSSVESFFSGEATTELARITKLVVKQATKTTPDQVVTEIAKALGDSARSVSFLIALGLNVAVPAPVRVASIKAAIKTVGQVKQTPYLLLPVILAGCGEENTQVREAVVELLRKVCKMTKNAPKNKSPELYCEDAIYGKIEAADKAIIPPAVAASLSDGLLAVAADLALDGQRVISVLFDTVFAEGKHAVLYQTFVLNQWSLPLVMSIKTKAWAIVGSDNISKPAGNDGHEFFFADDVVPYLTHRQLVVDEAKLVGVDNTDTLVVQMVGSTEQEAEWLIDALNVSGLAEAASARIVSLCQQRVFAEEVQNAIVTKYIDVAVSEDIAVDAAFALQQLPLSVAVVNNALESVNFELPESTTTAKRRRRSSSFAKNVLAKGTAHSSAILHLRRLAVVLETVVAGFKTGLIAAKVDLLESLFSILTDLDLLGHDGNLPISYPQELVVQAMLTVLKSRGKSTVPDRGVRVDVVVNCLRNAHSPQLQNRLLLVVAELASIAPETVLHSIMPIFTFMGAATIRQDDEFSQSTLLHTVATVVPVLVAAAPTSVSSEVEFLLTSFVATFHHIPPHRRRSLFVNLTKVLGAATAMSLVLFLMAQQYVKSETSVFLEFVQDYLCQFSAGEQLAGISGFLELVQTIPSTQLTVGSDEYAGLVARSAFGAAVTSLDDAQLLKLKASLVQFITALDLSTLKLDINVAVADETADAAGCLQKVQQIMGWCLSAIDTFSSVTPSSEMVEGAYKLLTSVLDFLPLPQLVDVIKSSLSQKQLVDESSITLATNYAQLLGRRFEVETTGDDVEASGAAMVVLPVLAEGFTSDSTVLSQSYIDTYATIVDKVAIEDHKLLVEALKVLCGNFAASSAPEVVIASTRAIGAIVTALGVKTMAFYPKIVPPALSLANTAIEEDEESSNLVVSAVVALLATMIKRIPTFMSSTLGPILSVMVRASSMAAPVRRQVVAVVLDHIDPSEVLKSLCTVWPEVAATGDATTIGVYLAAVDDSITRVDKKQAAKVATQVFKWVVSVFEFRSSEQSQAIDTNTGHRLENQVFNSIIQFIMKLNDKTFRPSFVKLVRWVVDGEGAAATADNRYRWQVFFRFFTKLQEQLRGIITQYFSYLVDPVAKLLDQFATQTIEDAGWQRIVLNSLTSSFKFDNDDYWAQQGRFEAICTPLLAQIAHIQPEISKYLVKAVTSFIANVSSDEYNQTLVNELVKYLAPEQRSEAKICTVRILKSVFQKLGDQWLSFLPTMIPSIAELLEDDDEKVELEVRQGLVRVIEKVLGEPLDRYLS